MDPTNKHFLLMGVDPFVYEIFALVIVLND